MTHDTSKTPAENLLVDLKTMLPADEYARAYTVIMMMQRSLQILSSPTQHELDAKYLIEIATLLGCHKAFIVNEITKLQNDLKGYEDTFKAMRELTEMKFK